MLTPIRISSPLHWLLFCLCLLPITGCVFQATPDTSNLVIHDDAPLLLPQLSLVRRVVPEVGTKSRTSGVMIPVTNDAVREVSESRFGDPDEEADLSCVNAGLKETLPGIDLVPTTTFWEQVAAPRDRIELSELFVAPQSDRLRAFQADVIVIAYHKKIDVETMAATNFVDSMYADTDRETAAIIVIDLHRKAIIHGSKISFEDVMAIGHIIVIPIVIISLDPSDICNAVARQAGAAIAEAMPGGAVRALVVAAGGDPYEAVSRINERSEIEGRANQGDSDAQWELALAPGSQKEKWLCRAAHAGNAKAQHRLGKHYRHGFGGVEADMVTAYLWLSLSETNGFKYPVRVYTGYGEPATGEKTQPTQREIVANSMTSAQITEAKRLVAEWQPNPAECEIEGTPYGN